MKQPSRVRLALIIVLFVTGAGFAHLALAVRQAPVETAQTKASPSDGTVDTVVGDETPFTPEW
jgi:hypothetical protein